MSDLALPNRRPWKTAVLAGMASYLDAGALVTSGIALGGYYAGPMRLDAGTIGHLLGLQTLAFAAGALLGGRLGDRFGRRGIFTSSLVLYAIGIAVLMTADGPGPLYAGVAAVGLAIGADLPVSLALINEQAAVGRKGTMVVSSSLFWLAGILVVLALSSFMGVGGASGGRILFAHLLLVSVVVLLLRLTLGESAEWAAARQSADPHQPSDLRRLLRRPVLSAMLAAGLYYAAWNLGSNTLGQFGTFMWTSLAGGQVATYSRLVLVGLPLGIVPGLLFMRAVDKPARRRVWFACGTALLIVAWSLPVVLGPTKFSLVAVMLISGFGNAFAGETMFRVWAQELFPTLLRATANGVMTAFARVLAGLAALSTPAFALGHTTVFFELLLGLMIAAAVIGLVWMPRLTRTPQTAESSRHNLQTAPWILRKRTQP